MDWLKLATEFSFDNDVTISARRQRDGSLSWSVVRMGFTLNTDDEWEWEPSPSSRNEDYLRRNRYKTKEDALERMLALAGGTAQVAR